MIGDSSKKMRQDLRQLVGSARQVAGDLGDEIARTAGRILDDARATRRQLVVSVRLDDESVRRVEQLLDADICRSRSEAVAFLTRSGITARQDLFDRIEEKIDAIRQIKDELRREAQAGEDNRSS